MLSDLRLAFRQLRQSPGFTFVAVLSLALGIGANTTIFSLVNEVMLRALPVRAPEQLVLFSWSSSTGAGPRSLNGWNFRDETTGEQSSTSMSKLTYERIRESAGGVLSDVFAFAPIYRLNVVVEGQAEVVGGGQVVSGNYHEALGVPIIAGRALRPSDDTPAATPVAVISDRYWQRHFAGSPTAIGRTMLLNGVITEIVGVTTPAFPGTLQVGEVQDITVPLALYPRMAPDDTDAPEPWSFWLRIMGRLAPGKTREQVAGALTGVFHESIKDAFDRPSQDAAQPAAPVDPKTFRLRVASGAQGLTEARRTHAQSLWILTGLVALVLLVACANVANLLLARGAARQREITVRLALGASRGRILRQLLTESLLLGLLAGGTGLLLAIWGRDALLALQPLGRSANVLELPLDWRVLGFTTAAALGTGILFGLAPAWRATKVDLAAGFAGGPRTLGGRRSHLTRALMVTQVALSLVLLVGAGLFTRTLVNLQRRATGFDRSQLLLFQVDAMSGGVKRPELAPFYTRLADRFATLPGVRAVGYSQVPVLSGSSWTTNVSVQGFTPPPGHQDHVLMNGINPSFFGTVGIPLVLGRNFSAADDAAAARVAIVNQTFARTYFGEESPIGRRIGFDGPKSAGEIEIVGVARDALYTRLRESPRPAAYLPYPQLRNAHAGSFILRVEGDPAALAPSLRTALREIDPNLPLANLRTQVEQIARSLTSDRMFARLAGFFGVLALLLAGIGLYGLLSFAVLRRTGEIGLRLALGALPRRVLWMVVRESLLLVGLGVGVGLAAAAAASRLVSSRLFGLTQFDPTTYIGVTLILLTVAVVAAYLPARKASRVSPMEALRTE